MRLAPASVALLLLSVGSLFFLGGASGAGATARPAPNLAAGSAYLAAPANLKAGRYYESFPGTADFGLTLDGAFALAATGDQEPALRQIVAFLRDGGQDPAGQTVNAWTAIGTADVSGGAIGKEALLAEVTGASPRNFSGHDLIAALDASVCAAKQSQACPAPGAYRNTTSVFDQAFGVLAQLRAGQAAQAKTPVAYLESLQDASGSFPSLIPPSGPGDVDSTAMAVMALALARDARAAAAVKAGVAWIAGRQEADGGFPGTAPESVNSTGLAVQALTLQAGTYGTRIRAARSFLAGQQDANGGFNASPGQKGANLRASTQALGGTVGTSFGTLRVDLSLPGSPSPPSSTDTPAIVIAIAALAVLVAALAGLFLVWRRRR